MTTESAAPRSSEESLGQRAMRAFTGVIGVAVILSAAVLLNPSWGAWTRLAIVPLVICSVLAVLVTVARIMLRLRGSRTSRLVAGLAPLLGPSWDAKRDLRTSRFSRGRPRRVKIDYPDSISDRDPEWRRRVEEMVRQRIEVEKVTSTWDTRRGRVVIDAWAATTENDREELQREAAQKRAHDILRPMFGTEITVTVTDWEEPAKENAS